MHNEYMLRAITLAKKGAGHTSPNPMVGCVIVKDDEIIAEGYHERYGELHAERNAFKNLTKSAKGASLYVTLEPCCHYGKTPPCTDAIIENEIKEVFIGSYDPNPLVSGKGIQILRDHGIVVHTEILKDQCDQLNEIFFHYIKNNTPFVIMKYAMTLDGKISCYTGDSKWITDTQARNHVHETRHLVSGIMVGVGTVLADNPMLDCRIPNGINPIRIICDSNLRTPLDSNIAKTASDITTIIACAVNDENKIKQYHDIGIEVLVVPDIDGRIDLKELMVLLGQRKIDSVLLEGGSTLNYTAIASGIVHKVQAYIAPKIVGGFYAKSPIGGQGIAKMQDAIALDNVRYTTIGQDLLIEGYVKEDLCLQELLKK